MDSANGVAKTGWTPLAAKDDLDTTNVVENHASVDIVITFNTGAGNEYENATFQFDIDVLATQAGKGGNAVLANTVADIEGATAGNTVMFMQDINGSVTLDKAVNFDGGDYTISNLYINMPDSNNVGLFGIVGAAGRYGKVCNLKLENVDVAGNVRVGAMFGTAGSTNIDGDSKNAQYYNENLHVSGNISIKGNRYVAGLAGYGYTRYDNCSVVGDGANSSIVATDLTAGGLVAHTGNDVKNDISIRNCRVANIGLLQGAATVGGIIGHTFNASVSGCTVENVNIQAVGTATTGSFGATSFGGIVGGCQSWAKMKIGNCTTINVVYLDSLNPNYAGGFGQIFGGILGDKANLTVLGNMVDDVLSEQNDQ